MENPFEIINNRLERIEKLLENIYSDMQENRGNPTSPKIMNLKQLANYLSISTSNIYKLTGSRNIPHSKNGKKLYFEKSILDAWFLKNTIMTNDDLEQEALKYTLKRKFKRR
ncbi:MULTISPECIES: helix-turn-helix domain-containing protein [unclassified Polaribacter]|uniref:helix-turn-helix domain-containing protein n=1 Tax=unclassified Polaribacter TaxID=196858 RepID=UPI0011BDC9AC|nr:MULTISPECIES: helix-turn-helix domain-containing protein [unclassified Polaribacter]TXD53643.1 helix-turn-helix domain-containing protein [Polaribacter sp. IC063]TXD62117.1 helix-turn-helix domain-containing protein [Polaribacter sp. IC066]